MNELANSTSFVYENFGIDLERALDPIFRIPEQTHEFLEYTTKNFPGSVVVLEKTVFESMSLDCRSRAKEYSSMHEYIFIDQNDAFQDKNSEKSLLPDFKNLGDSFNQTLSEKFYENSDEISTMYSNISQKVESVNENLKNYKLLHDSNVKLNKLFKSLSNLFSSLTQLNSDLSLIQDFLQTKEENNTLELLNFDNNSIEILRFEYCFNKGSWMIKIVNKSENNLENVDIYNVENNELICRFKSIQPLSSIKKFIKLKYKKYYELHLIAAIGEKIVSSAFFVNYFHISYDLTKSNQAFIVFTIKNHSLYAFENLEIVTSTCKSSFEVKPQILNCHQSYKKEIPLISVQNSRVFLVQGNKIISNSLNFTIKEELLGFK